MFCLLFVGNISDTQNWCLKKWKTYKVARKIIFRGWVAQKSVWACGAQTSVSPSGSPWCNPFGKWLFDWLVGVDDAIVSTWSSSLYPFLFPLKFNFPLTADTQLVVADFFDFHSFIAARGRFFLFTSRPEMRACVCIRFFSLFIALNSEKIKNFLLARFSFLFSGWRKN